MTVVMVIALSGYAVMRIVGVRGMYKITDHILEVHKHNDKSTTYACTNLTGEHTPYMGLQKHWTTTAAYEWYWNNYWGK